MHERTCPVDGTVFTTVKSNKKYCSLRCSKSAERRRYRATHTERAQCKHCGAGFQRPIARVAGGLKVYCSTSCQYEARSIGYAQREDIRPPIRERDLGNYYDLLRHDPCAYCGEQAGHIDHIEARSRDGANHWENYTAVCARCNTSKRDKPLLGFLGWRAAAQEFDAWRRLCEQSDSIDSRATIAAAATAAAA